MHRLKQSVSWWCFAQRELSPQTLVRAAADIGYEGIELVDQAYWPLIKEHGLSIVSTNAGLSIEQGWNRREHHAHLEQKMRAALHLAEQWSIPIMIVFSGNRQGLSDRAGIEITAEGLARVAQAAEDAGATLAIELLNTDPLPAKAQEVPVPPPTLLVYRVGTRALVGYSQDFEADALRRR